MSPRAPHDIPALGSPMDIALPTGRAPVVSPARAGWTVALLSFAAFIFVTNEILPIGLITLMADDLGRTEAQIGVVATAYALMIAAVSIPLAHVTRSIPRRLLLTVATVGFSVGTLVVATSHDFSGLVIGRLISAVSQAQFWAVVTATAAGLFPPDVRGKIVARLLIGPSAAGVLGLPAATWLGQNHGWRVPFFVLGGLGIALAVALGFMVPRYKPADGAASRGSNPSRRRFVIVLGVTTAAVLGNSVAFTYVTPYLSQVTGFGADVVPALFLASGVAGVVAMLTVARFLDRFPRRTMAVGLALIGLGWGGIAAFATAKPAVVVFFCAVGLGLSVLVGSLASRVMQVSPGSTDMGIGTYGALYQVGIAAGSFLGKGLLESTGPSPLPIVAAGFLGLALGLLAVENHFSLPAPRTTANVDK